MGCGKLVMRMTRPHEWIKFKSDWLNYRWQTTVNYSWCVPVQQQTKHLLPCHKYQFVVISSHSLLSLFPLFSDVGINTMWIGPCSINCVWRFYVFSTMNGHSSILAWILYSQFASNLCCYNYFPVLLTVVVIFYCRQNQFLSWRKH